MSTAPSAPAAPQPHEAPAEPPKPANPEPTSAPKDPEGDRVHDPEQGKSEHPRQ
jgi:hypothetical protein